jgi:hypothetical protein
LSDPVFGLTRDFDPRLTARGVTVHTPPLAPGAAYWRVAAARWFDMSESGGRHHIYVEALTPNGELMEGVPFQVTWPDGESVRFTKAGRGFEAGNFPMSPSLREFNVMMSNGTPSESVEGIGMGADGNPGIHTATLVTFQQATAPTLPAPPVDPPAPPWTPQQALDEAVRYIEIARSLL